MALDKTGQYKKIRKSCGSSPPDGRLKFSPLRRRGVGVAAFSLGLSPFSFADKGEITTREMVLCRDEPPI